MWAGAASTEAMPRAGLLLLEVPKRPPNPVGQGACDAPVRGGLGGQFKARGLDHQPHASELPRCLRSPAQQAEVEAAWSAEAKSQS